MYCLAFYLALSIYVIPCAFKKKALVASLLITFISLVTLALGSISVNNLFDRIYWYGVALDPLRWIYIFVYRLSGLFSYSIRLNMIRTTRVIVDIMQLVFTFMVYHSSKVRRSY